jgi:hypothetical protein
LNQEVGRAKERRGQHRGKKSAGREFGGLPDAPLASAQFVVYTPLRPRDETSLGAEWRRWTERPAPGSGLGKRPY